MQDTFLALLQEEGQTADAGGVFGEPNSAEHSLPLVRESGTRKVAASYLSEGE
jgi:hypothetical protein